MMFVLRDLARTPAAIGIVLALVGAVGVTRTRFARWAIDGTPPLVWLWVQAGQFDPEKVGFFGGRPSAMGWAFAAELRGLAGLALLLLAPLIGMTAAKLVGVRRGALLGLAVLGPFGAGLLSSSVVAVRSVLAVLAQPEMETETKLRMVKTAVARSESLVSGGTGLSLLIGAAMVVWLLGSNPVPDACHFGRR
jgi:hypothetical protein